jgi:uncharacterized membrane protein
LQRLLAVGICVIVVGMVILLASVASQGQVSGGGVIFLGPFPIVFGSGPSGGLLALISLVIGGIMVALTFLWVRSPRTP